MSTQTRDEIICTFQSHFLTYYAGRRKILILIIATILRVQFVSEGNVVLFLPFPYIDSYQMTS
jgi:hypothetical protein